VHPPPRPVARHVAAATPGPGGTRPPTVPPRPPLPRWRRPRRRLGLVLAVVVLVAGGTAYWFSRPGLSPMRARIVALATSQVGYRTSPPDSYCNKYSAFYDAGSDICGPGLLSEEWCADFAAWVWQHAGAVVDYQLGTGYLNSASASFYSWGVDHDTWHPAGSHYVPVPGDVAVYGLDTATLTADHVAVVIGVGAGGAPDVVNGDGDRTGFSVVEIGLDQRRADIPGGGGWLSGYVSPIGPQPAHASTG
jgi:hypothetical protein